MSGVTCQVSHVCCHVSGVTRYLSHVTNANSHMSLTPTATVTNPPPAILPHFAQLDAVADLDLGPSTMSGKERERKEICAPMFNHF